SALQRPCALHRARALQRPGALKRARTLERSGALQRTIALKRTVALQWTSALQRARALQRTTPLQPATALQRTAALQGAGGLVPATALVRPTAGLGLIAWRTRLRDLRTAGRAALACHDLRDLLLCRRVGERGGGRQRRIDLAETGALQRVADIAAG